jgi:hypothetical protein
LSLVAISPTAALAQLVDAPEILGVLAGEGSPQEPTGVRVFGTDLGRSRTRVS